MIDDKVLAVVVCYNDEKCIEDCVRSLQKQSYANMDILIVDNASSDKSVQIIKRLSQDVILLELEQNVGFGIGNNIGLNYAMENEYDYVLLINSDTEADEYLIEKMIPYAKENCAVIPKIYSNKRLKELWYAAGRMDFENGFAYGVDAGKADCLQKVTFMVGCCMFFHVNTIKKIGLFDENYFLYNEDDDLSVRMTVENIDMIYVPDTWVWHKMGYRRKRLHVMYYMTRNRLYLVKKYRNVFQISPAKLIVQLIRKVYLSPTPMEIKFRKYILLGIKDYLCRKMGKRDKF